MNSDHERFLALHLRHHGDIRAFVYAVVRDWTRTDDILQEVALVLWRRFAEYDPAFSFGAWARGIAANELLKDRDRRRRAMPQLSPEAVLAVQAASDAIESPANPRLEALTACLERVDPRVRTLIDLRYREDLPLDEIASRTQRSLAAVGKALLRVRDSLQRCVAIRLGDVEHPKP